MSEVFSWKVSYCLLFSDSLNDVSFKTFIFALSMPWATLIVIVTDKHKIK